MIKIHAEANVVAHWSRCATSALLSEMPHRREWNISAILYIINTLSRMAPILVAYFAFIYTQKKPNNKSYRAFKTSFIARISCKALQRLRVQQAARRRKR